ncbi:MAG: hypothetical protein PHV30_09115 [Candidatus Margulisbacteria bacterium]|nr:hypothetical protein [Candidatus Margulisiibacteriota bacterium]
MNDSLISLMVVFIVLVLVYDVRNVYIMLFLSIIIGSIVPNIDYFFVLPPGLINWMQFVFLILAFFGAAKTAMLAIKAGRKPKALITEDIV